MGLFRGEFEVVRQLLEKLKDGKGAKNECDKVIDKNGTAKTGGTGIKHLRENIAESKLSYEIMDNIHKYYYMIAFTAYMREAADLARNAVSEEQKEEGEKKEGEKPKEGEEEKPPAKPAA